MQKIKLIKIIGGLVILMIGLAIGGIVDRHYQVGTKIASTKEQTMNLTFTQPQHAGNAKKYVFLNASQNTNGTTSGMAKAMLANHDYQQINLADYNIPQLGQGEGDFQKVYDQLKGADVIVIGTPVYWFNMSGYLKTFIDHISINSELAGADLYAIVQGMDSHPTEAIQSTYGSLNRVSMRLQLNFVGIASTDNEVRDLKQIMAGR